MPDEVLELILAGPDEWRAWLGAHAGEAAGAWVVLAKKGKPGPTTLTYEQALDEAIAHGWIDGLIGRRDESTYRQRFTPRRAKSNWTSRNAERAARLEREGRMRPAGFAAIERAKAEGRWPT